MLQWARANGCAWDARTCEFAAEGGHVEVVQWARANGCPEPGYGKVTSAMLATAGGTALPLAADCSVQVTVTVEAGDLVVRVNLEHS